MLALCASPAQAEETSWCPKRSTCNPVMEAWCRQNAEILKTAADEGKKYVYHDVQCDKAGCCVEPLEKTGPGAGIGGATYTQTYTVFPAFLQALVDKNRANVDCWLCGLLESIFVRGDLLATRLYTSMSHIMLFLLGVMTTVTLLWFAFRVFVDFSGKESRAFLQKSTGLFARVAIIALILIQSPSSVGNFFFAPFISLGTGLGLEMLAVSAGGQEASHPHITYFTQHLYDEDSIMGCTHQEQSFWDNHPDLLLSKATCNMLVGLVQIISIEVTTPINFGMAYMRFSTNELRWGFVPHWGPFFYGALMIIAFFCILILVPFKVIDIFVQLIVASCFLPLALTLFAFPATRKYTQAMWKLFLACIIQLVMLSLMVALAVNLFVGSGGATNQVVLPLFLMGEDEEAYKALAMAGNGIIASLGASFIAFYLITRAASFAKQLGMSINLGTGDALQDPFMSATAKTAGTAAGGVKTLWDKATGNI
ncbi:MAG: hypothetical protein ILP11_01705 [Alphaproteobacteria bacterium]|nr:hypothetical protein [Alphaproteobacteria bacterium]